MRGCPGAVAGQRPSRQVQQPDRKVSRFDATALKNKLQQFQREQGLTDGRHRRQTSCWEGMASGEPMPRLEG